MKVECKFECILYYTEENEISKTFFIKTLENFMDDSPQHYV